MLGPERPRFVVDVPVAKLRAPSAAPEGAGMALGVRHARRGAQSSRVVIDLAAPARLVRRAAGAGPQGWRVTYDLAPVAAPAAAAAPGPVRVLTPAADRRVNAASGKVVVVDAGHGGRDCGALSPTGRREKDMTLAAAQALRAELESRGYRVVMTRDRDVFIPLAERVRIAREAKADLFISLHADSSPDRTAQGATIYTLSQSGQDRAKDLMDAQDWRVDLGQAPHSGTAADILVDLTQRETSGRSAEFADTLAAYLRPAWPLIENARRNAGYFVLLAPDVPAALLEMGFMTNAKDLARLADPRARRILASAIADSIDAQLGAPERSYAEAGAGAASFRRALAP